MNKRINKQKNRLMDGRMDGQARKGWLDGLKEGTIKGIMQHECMD